MNVNDLVARAAKYDEGLARDIQRFVENRQFGLVYEESKPEFVRLYKKPVVVGDTVNILPPRGQMENTSSDTDEREIKWRVVSITGQTAHLSSMESEAETDASVDDLVPFVRFDQPIYAGLKEVDRVERGGDKPYQVVINGENFHALEALMFAHQGKVDCIYIDPPYNTGATDWKYNNNYVGKEDIYRHSKWLTFMEDRLRLAKKLLNPRDSVLICTIDENEYARLALLLEQIFPERNFDTVSVQMNPRGTQGGVVASTNEFMIISYLDTTSFFRKPHDGDDDSNFRKWGNQSTREEGAHCFYPIIVDSDEDICGFGDVLPDNLHPLSQVEEQADGTFYVWPIDISGIERKWRYERGTVESIIDLLQVEKSGERIEISILKESDSLKTMWYHPSYNAEAHGTKMLKRILGGKKRFDYPKSLYAVEEILRFFVSGKPEAIVLDFFGGSGTTTHAVMRLNHADGGQRRCICITNNEVSKKEGKRLTSHGARQGDLEWEEYGICRYVTTQRIKSSITGRKPDGSPIKGEYGVCRLDYIPDEDAQLISRATGRTLI